MSNVITFENYRPGPRQDAEPWTQATIEESASPSGSWTLIDTITLTPVDSNPASPQLRSFTTENATLADGWYRVTFLDADGDTQVTDPVQHTQTSRYFTVAEFRARYPEIVVGEYPDATVDQYRLMAEQAFEDAAGVAFVPRTATEALRSPNDVALQTRHRHVRSVDSATDAAGATVSLANGVRVDGSWLTLTNACWPLSLGAVTVTYTYGYDAPPLRVKQAVMALTREWMVSGPVTDRNTGIPVEGGGTISLALPGGRFGTFGLPEVDAVVEQYGLVSYVA